MCATCVCADYYIASHFFTFLAHRKAAVTDIITRTASAISIIAVVAVRNIMTKSDRGMIAVMDIVARVPKDHGKHNIHSINDQHVQ